MKSKINIPLVFILILTSVIFCQTNAVAQEKTKKQLKEEAKIEKQKQTQILIDSKEFVFVTRIATPQGGRIINLTEDYTVEFHPDTIKSDLPFFGRGFSGIGYGGDNGLRFKGKPEKYSVEKTKKATIIKTEVKTQQDFFVLMLSVYYDGNAYLSVSSNNRSFISYNGNIEVLKKK